MSIVREKTEHRRVFSLTMVVILMVGTLLMGISIQTPNVKAGSVNHGVGNVDIFWLTDYGRICSPISWNKPQTASDPSSGIGLIGLVIDQDNYIHTSGSENIADPFTPPPPYTFFDDFTPLGISMVVDDGTTQKSTGSFQNIGAGTGDPNDILVEQTVWTVANKDWAILQWKLNNLKASDLTGVCIGLEVPLSQVGTGFGIGGASSDGGDDIDGFDATNCIYWAQDATGSGTETTIGFGSADDSDPLTHYYAEDYHALYQNDSYPDDPDPSYHRNFYADETWLYERLHAPNATASDGITPGNITSTVGWNDFTIPVGSSKTFTLVMAIGDTYGNMMAIFNDAQNYFHTVASGFRITEFSDSSSVNQQIEVFNFGGGDTDLAAEGYFLSLDGGVTTLPGIWDKNPLPTNEYGVFTLTAGIIGPEGGTIGLYQDKGGGDIILKDEVAFGLEGIAPDPLNGESVAKRYDAVTASYTNEWLRNVTSGPTWGAQNDVPAINTTPLVVINEVMFHPTASDGGYITIINKDPSASVNVRDYYLVCDTGYRLSGFGDIWLDPYSMLTIKYSDNAPLFDNMDSGGDNVYLYNSSGGLIDMVGWNTAHLKGMSMRRIPDGSGTFQGYNDITSESAEWVFNIPLDVLVTEISDSGSTTSQIEVYNPWYPPMDFSVGFMFESHAGMLAGSWSPPTVDSGEYAVFTVTTPDGLDAEGDTISLYQNGVLIEELSYGQNGVIPDPLPDESVERYQSGSEYSDVWMRNYTTGPNFGAQNDVPPANFNFSLVLNEIMFNPDMPADGFVELYLKWVSLNISGYKIVGNSEYIIPEGTTLTPDDRFFYLLQLTEPAFFGALNPSGDNMYLYDDNGRLLDMAGWSSLHVQGATMCRVPNGNGTRNGYDDTSSTAAGWVFDSTSSVQMVKLSTRTPSKYGSFGDVIYFNLSVFNKQPVDDIVLFSNSTINGYPVVILDETGTFVITEIFVTAGSFVNITVMVILPSTIPFIDQDDITITIQSENTPLYGDSIILHATILPFIWPDKNISPQEIYISGTGHDEIITVTLNLTGMGSIIEFRQPQDVIFCVDTSGSMTSQAIALIKDGLIGYVDVMNIPDLGAVVVFNDDASLMNPLTDDHEQLKNDIADIPDPNGATYMGEALETAIDEILANGNASHIRVIILLTDGMWNGDVNPLNQADRAATNNITIFTIGLRPSWPWSLDEATLISIAERTGGQYFHAEDASQIPDIYQVIAAYIGDIAGRDMDITDANPMIRDVLPPWIELVAGSFSINPDVNYVNETGYRILEWNLTSILIGETWEVTFQVKSTMLGPVHTNDYNTSRVCYIDYIDNEILRLFPECTANVLPPPPLPPKLYIDILPNKNDIFLYWDKPSSPGVDHYLIYRAQNPIDFDFSSPWVDTNNTLANGVDPVDKQVIPLRMSWNHTEAADPDSGNYSEQWYYCIRTVNYLGEISHTSRTVGKWTKEFTQVGVSTFSIPLKPLETMTADFYLSDMNANYIKWMDPVDHTWKKHGDGGVNNTQLEVGKGYEVSLFTTTRYTFLGLPGAMIWYDTESFIGFDYRTEAKSLTASVDPAKGDVTLTWAQPSSMDSDDYYYIYYATTRDGFDGTLDVNYFLSDILPYGTETMFYSGMAQPGTQYYIMIVPVNENDVKGASTYSIGIWTASYSAEYDTIGIPLILTNSDHTAHWYCNQMDDVVGINYFIHSAQRWGWHSKRMSEGAYDPMIRMCFGYQLSTGSQTKFSFVGV